MSKKLIGVFVGALMASTGAGAQTTVDFETGAPATFSATTPLTNTYSNLGLAFSGVGGAGASILAQNSNFGINARSGRDFLAFNGEFSALTEQVTFASAIQSFNIYLGGGNATAFNLSAFDANGLLVGTSSVLKDLKNYSLLSVSAANIRSVQFSGDGTTFVADDLSFTTAVAAAVPEPATWGMMILGVGLVGGVMRRRQKVSTTIKFA
jgi:hypothetical protein